VFKLLPGRYALVKAHTLPPYGTHLVVVNEGDSVTVFTDEEQLSSIPIGPCEKWFKVLAFNAVADLDEHGFLARITAVLSSAEISVLVFSSFATDLVAMREEDLPKALYVLSTLSKGVDPKLARENRG